METLDFILFNDISLRTLKKGVVLNREKGIFAGIEYNEVFGVFVPKNTDIKAPIKWHGCITWCIGGFEFETVIINKQVFHKFSLTGNAKQEEIEYFINKFMQIALQTQKDKYLGTMPSIDFSKVIRINPRLEAHTFKASTKSTPACATRWTTSQNKKFDSNFCNFLIHKSINFGIRCTGK